jgi:hypothetical protein
VSGDGRKCCYFIRESSYSVMTTTGGGIVPPPPPPPVRTTTVPTPMTSGSGSIPLMVLTTVSFTQNVTGAPFSYGMPDFDSNSVLTYSTLQTMGLGAGSSNAPLQGSVAWALLPLSMLFLMVGVIYLLCPLRSVACFSSQSGLMLIIVCLVEAVWDLHPTRCRWDLCHSLCLVHLETTLFLRLLSRLGETPTLVNKTLCKVPFLHRE